MYFSFYIIVKNIIFYLILQLCDFEYNCAMESNRLQCYFSHGHNKVLPGTRFTTEHITRDTA